MSTSVLADDDPLGEVLLGGRLFGEVAWRDGVAVEDDGGDTRRLHLRDHLRRGCLDRRRVELVGDDFGERRPGGGHVGGELVGQFLGGAAVLQVQQPELARLVLHGVAAMAGVLADDLLGEELDGVCLLLLRAAVEAPHVGAAVGVERGRLARRAADAHHLMGGQLVGEGAGQRRAAEHGERLVLQRDLGGVGTGGNFVGGVAGAFERDQVDLASVHLVVRLVVTDQLLHRRELVGVGVVDVDGIGDVGDDRIAFLALVVDDRDLVAGDARRSGTSVVAGERRIARLVRRSRARQADLSWYRTGHPSRRCPRDPVRRPG